MRELLAHAEGADREDGVLVLLRARAHQPEPAPGHVDVAGARVDRDRRALARQRLLVVQLERGAPGVAAVEGPGEHDVGLGVAVDPGPHHVDRAARDGAPELLDVAGGRAGPRDVDGDPGLVGEVRPGAALVDDLRVDPADRVGAADRAAVLLVVEVDEPVQDDAPVARASLEDDPGEVEHAVGARPDHRVGGGVVEHLAGRTAHRRAGALGGLVLRVAGHEVALPGLAAVVRLEDALPGVAAIFAARRP